MIIDNLTLISLGVVIALTTLIVFMVQKDRKVRNQSHQDRIHHRR